MLAEYDDTTSPTIESEFPVSSGPSFHRKTRTGAEQDSSFFKGSVGDFSFDGVIGGGMR
jgi:hypothetical protein